MLLLSVGYHLDRLPYHIDPVHHPDSDDTLHTAKRKGTATSSPCFPTGV